MAPYFIRNLLPRRRAEDVNRRPLSEVLLSLTWIQWAQFLTGYDRILSRFNPPNLIFAIDGLRGLATQSISLMLPSVSPIYSINSTKPSHLLS